MKYIDADRLREKLIERLDLFRELSSDTISPIRIDECKQIIDIIDSIQQDETQVDKMLCSQVWWEEQGWIMIPPDATIEGIDSLLNQVRKKLQQEQPSLPSDLDEAAVDYANRLATDAIDHELIKGYFKAGAQWRDAQIPKLPDSIDEAAEEWCKTNNKGIAISADKKSHYLAEGKDAFKAGAEWMAGQMK